jgi:hypothetical protein
VAFGVRERLDTLERADAKPAELRVSGGAAQIALWNQIKADVTGIPVVRIPGDPGPVAEPDDPRPVRGSTSCGTPRPAWPWPGPPGPPSSARC